MKGYILVSEDGIRTQKMFDYWIEQCLEFNPIAKASPKKKLEEISISNL